MKTYRKPTVVQSPQKPVDPLDAEVNRILTTRFCCTSCQLIKNTMAKYVARENDRKALMRAAVDSYSEALGQRAYSGYCEHTNGVSLVSGAPLPKWSGLDPAIKAAWGAAAKALLEAKGGAV